MPRTIAQMLEAIEVEMGQHTPNADVLIAAFRQLVLPSDVASADLDRLYSICERLMTGACGGMTTGSGSARIERDARFLADLAAAQVEGTLFDREADKRRWIAERLARFRSAGRPVPPGLNDSQLPPRLDIPWDEATAAERLRPFLRFLEDKVRAKPICHFMLFWDVERWGYPVFRPVLRRAMADFEARAIGMPGTADATTRAAGLDDRVKALRDAQHRAEPITWDTCVREVLPLLDHPHPMLAAGAGRYLGALYANGGFDEAADALPLPEVLALLCQLDRHRAAVSGGFVDGYDDRASGLGSLEHAKALQTAAFDLDCWVIEVLSGAEESYLPNAQAFWFYVHEHYCARPDFVDRLIDMRRAWVALMCATEVRGEVDGMRPVLGRLVTGDDPEIASAAQEHIDRYYRADDSASA